MIAQLPKLLEVCGLEPEEMEEEIPRAESAFQKLGLTAEDIARGNHRITQYFDIELLGVRKVLGVCLKELVDLVLAKGQAKTMLYATLPTVAKDIITAAMLNSNDVHPANPGVLFELTMGGIFNKLDPILEAAERLWLGPGEAHCGYVQIELGLMALDLIPKADLCIVTAFPCDELAKSQELLSAHFDVPVQYVNRCQDRDWREPVNAPRDVQFLTSEIDRYIESVGKVVGFEITDEMLAEARRFRTSVSTPVRQVQELLRESDPTPMSATIVPFIRFLDSMPVTRRAKEGTAEAASILLGELNQRVSQGVGAVPEGAPRVLHEVWPSYSDPRITQLLEELDIAVVVFENELYEPDGRLSPDTRGFTRPAEKIASGSTQRCNLNHYRSRANSISGACQQFDLDGVFWFNHPACRYYGTDAWLVKDIVQKQLGIPFLIVEGDFFDSRSYSLEQLRLQLETFAEMVRGYKDRR